MFISKNANSNFHFSVGYSVLIQYCLLVIDSVTKLCMHIPAANISLSNARKINYSVALGSHHL